MRKLLLLSVFTLTVIGNRTTAQCIDDIYYLVDSPKPCFFVGSVGTAQPDCFEAFAFPAWQYKWIIRNAANKEEVATYQGMAFAHQFTKFGGYDFCLEIDKDGDPTNAPDWVECRTYTTCEICSQEDISFEYKDCSSLEGCKVELKAKIDASNAVGVKPFAKYIVTYIPTPNEGPNTYELEYKDIPVQYDPTTGIIQVSDAISVPYVRGCYQPRLVFELEYESGGHYIYGGTSCEMVVLQGEKVFRCIACYNEAGECMNSIYASKVANETGTCNPHGCVLGRNDENADAASISTRQFSAMPNPAQGFVRLSAAHAIDGEYTILLFNARGQVELTGQWEGSAPEKTIDLLDKAPGIYLLAVFQDGERVFAEKLVVRE